MDYTQLEWRTYDGSIPNGAVSIYNGYENRVDYVAKFGNIAGFYNPDKGEHCYFAEGDKEHTGSPFELLVNRNNFECLKWKSGSNGSVPNNCIFTEYDEVECVGKNEYGLGKMVPREKALFVSRNGRSYRYEEYQVLTFSKGVQSEQITDVKYNIDDINIIKYPPETVNKSTVTNKAAHPVTETVTLSKSISVEQRWDTDFSLTAGVSSSVSAGIPEIAAASVTVSVETSMSLSRGTSRTDSTNYSVAVACDVEPKHSCTIKMVAYKFGADIPYTARLRRTYRNGETTWTAVTGTYKGVSVGEVRAVVEPSVPL